LERIDAGSLARALGVIFSGCLNATRLKGLRPRCRSGWRGTIQK
jgi:hypothetical protein